MAEHDAIDTEAMKRVLDAALLTRHVFSTEALRGLQPSPELEDKQLKPSGAQALFLLEAQPGLSITQLAKALSISQAATSFAVARLIQAKYVLATQDEDDGRVFRHEVTPAGRSCILRILSNAALA